jgi:hypothetical protein
MNKTLRVALHGTPDQFAQLRALQAAFASVCNAIAPVVQSSRCWNRVALHHLVYRTMRERFPALGSQMICNAVYSISRSARLVYQNPNSPWNVNKRPDEPLPLLQFTPVAPVYFDLHTLSLKGSRLSMFTLDGRVRFDLRLDAAESARFHAEKLIEVVLLAAPRGYELLFFFAAPGAAVKLQEMQDDGQLPEYLVVIPPEESVAVPVEVPPAARPDASLESSRLAVR